MMAEERYGLLNGLITSKLFPQILDPRIISRSNSISRALEGLPKGCLISLIAPAGSGKSSLMTQLYHRLSESGIASSWIGLDAEDNDPATFARYFISSLHHFNSNFAAEELTALEANPVRDYNAFFQRLEIHFSSIETSIAIFIDDFQHIHDDRILKFFDNLLSRLPRNISLLIASRHQLPLQIARLFVTGRAVEINQDELSFDQDQTDLFLRRYYQIELNNTELERLVNLTEGWPAGIQLVALAIQRHRGPIDELLNTFSGRDRDLTRYLAESVINSQPADIRRFLLRTSVLRRMCPDLCAAIGAASNATEMLAEVGRANLFLIALDRQGQWFRYHHLFAEFLQGEFRRRDPNAYREACLSAAQWCDINNEPAEAIRYALDAENHERAADLISRHAIHTSLYRGDHYSVRSWMRRLPEEHHSHRPELMLAHAWSCAFSRDTEHSMRIAESVARELQADRWALGAPECERWMLWTRGVQAAACACADDIEDCETRALELLPRVSSNEPFLVATLGNCLSYSYFAQRDYESSRRYAILARENGHLAGAIYLSSWGDFLHGLIDVELGELRAASRFSERLRRESDGLGLGPKSYVAGLSALLESEVAVQRGDFSGAATQIDIGRAFKEIFGPVEPQLVAIRNEARLLTHLRQFDHAQNILEEGQDAALREHHRRLYVTLAIEQISLMLTANQIGDALKASQRTGILNSNKQNSGWERALRDSIRSLEARIRLAQGEFDAALRILTTLQYAWRFGLKGSFYLSITAHRALALWSLGQESDAVRQLDRALSLASDEGNIFSILGVGNGLIPILQLMNNRRSGIETPELKPKLDLQKRVLCYLRDEDAHEEHSEEATQSVTTRPALGGSALTDREIQILQLLRSGLDNKSIANTLFVSIPTVKWHLHNVYDKLQVRSRGEALAAAVRRGLL